MYVSAQSPQPMLRQHAPTVVTWAIIEKMTEKGAVFFFGQQESVAYELVALKVGRRSNMKKIQENCRKRDEWL